jgi:hypothetical protein
VQVSKRWIAREWLIFLTLLALDGFVSFFGEYYHDNPAFYKGGTVNDADTAFSASYGVLWNETFGLTRAWPLFLWFLPYLAVMLIRSISWSIKALAIRPPVK